MFSRMRWALYTLALCIATSACAQDQQSPDGAELYARHCAACHGQRGEGDGPVASVMEVTVPNLRTLRQRSNGTFPRAAVIAYIDGRDLPVSHGDRYMPIWGNVFSWAEDDEERESVVASRIEALADFLAQIQQ